MNKNPRGKIKHIVFVVIKQKAIPFDFSLEELKRFPVHEHYLTELQEITVVYKYKPTLNLNEEEYVLQLTNKLKRKYNAYSVVVAGSLEDQKRLKR